jgi:type IV pilus assembly protein PilP
MKKQNQPYLILMFIGLFFMMSCHEPEKKSTPEISPKIIRQKVMLAAQAQPATTKKAESTSITVNNLEEKLVSKEIINDKEKTDPTQKNNKITASSSKRIESENNPQQEKASPKPHADKELDKSMPPSETDMDMLLEKLAPKPFNYHPQGKVDPFLPLIAKKKTTTPTKTDTVQREIQKKRTRILTLLEKYDLSQLRLTAVMKTSKQDLAIVEVSSGRGFVVRTGTRIGLNSGRVVDILWDRIIVQETKEVIAGKKIYVPKDMKLNKPVSEN